MSKPYDVTIIGAGVVGTLTAYYASQYKLRVCVIEKNTDIGAGATKANSGIIHGGYDDPHGSFKSQFCRAGNHMYEGLHRTLDFTFNRIGSLVVAFNNEERARLEMLRKNGIANGVTDTRIVDAVTLRGMEPAISPNAVSALYCPSVAVVAPFEVCAAAAEQSAKNGAEYKLSHTVTAIIKNKKSGGSISFFTIETQTPSGYKSIHSRFVVNCAGLYADDIARMVGINSFTITPVKGEYILYDRSIPPIVHSVIFQTPTDKGKGILVTPTYAGNIMLGPNAVEATDKQDTTVDVSNLPDILQSARRSAPALGDIDISKCIRFFAGLRAKSNAKDFVIDTTSCPGFICFGGIQSPGLTSAPALALHALRCMKNHGLVFKPTKSLPSLSAHRRVGITVTPRASFVPAKRAADDANLPEGAPERIICRCEQVREHTVCNALSRVPATCSVDAVKRLTRAGMGACQGAFCRPRVSALIACARGISQTDVPTESTRDATATRTALKALMCKKQ